MVPAPTGWMGTSNVIRVLVGLALLATCSGCALTKADIEVPYVPGAPAAPVAGASGAPVDVRTTDGRTTNRDRVGVKKNGYGMEMASIVATNDLPATVTGAFKTELAARGFGFGTGGADVQVALVRFYNDFKTGFFSGDAAATVAFNVKVVGRDGGTIFGKYYEGNGTEPTLNYASGDNASAALTKALTAAVASAINDPDFIAAVIKAGGLGAGPAAVRS
jgi:uncharacterized lipoprotein YajG